MSLAFVLALVVVVVVGLVLGRRQAGAGGAMAKRVKPACRWSETGAQNGRFVEYRCAACDVTAYSATGQAPVICKRNLKGKS